MKTIFLADDDADDALFFTEALKDLNPNAKVIHAQDGIELLQLLNVSGAGAPDAFIFLDINIPRKNGLEVLAEMRKGAGHSHAKIIMLSTSTSYKEIDTAYLLGADYFISKPLLQSALKNALAKIFFADFSVKTARDKFVISSN